MRPGIRNAQHSGVDAPRHPKRPAIRRGCVSASEAPSKGESPTMTTPLPDRLSTDPQSPFYDADVLKREVGIRFNGTEKTNVEEYCVSEGWIRVAAGKAKDRRGNAITIKLKGKVEPYFRGSGADGAA
jgi:hypothetical protein